MGQTSPEGGSAELPATQQPTHSRVQLGSRRHPQPACSETQGTGQRADYEQRQFRRGVWGCRQPDARGHPQPSHSPTIAPLVWRPLLLFTKLQSVLGIYLSIPGPTPHMSRSCKVICGDLVEQVSPRFSFFLIKFLLHFYYFFFFFLLAALGLCCCARAFSSCSMQGPLFVFGAWASHCNGFSCYGARALGEQAQ